MVDLILAVCPFLEDRLTVRIRIQKFREELDAGNGRLEVLGQPPVSIEPGERALDDPSAGQDLEALHARRDG